MKWKRDGKVCHHISSDQQIDTDFEKPNQTPPKLVNSD